VWSSVSCAGGVECWTDTVARCAGAGIHRALAERVLCALGVGHTGHGVEPERVGRAQSISAEREDPVAKAILAFLWNYL
jgi:hypothetical protein